MSLRDELIEAGARAQHVQWVDFDTLHPEDQEAARLNAAEILDVILDTLEVSDEWNDAVGYLIDEHDYAWEMYREAEQAEADLHREYPDEPWADIDRHRPKPLGAYLLKFLREERDDAEVDA